MGDDAGPERWSEPMTILSNSATGVSRKVWAFAALVLLAACGDTTDAPVAPGPGTSAGDAGSDACENGCARSDGAAPPTNDGGLPDASADAGPDAESAVDAGTDTGAGAETGPSGPPQTISGLLAGLTSGESITLQNNSGDNLTLSANGTFTFAKPVARGGAYSVSVLTPPASPIAQTCLVWDGSGTIGTAPVTEVRVNCDLLAYFPFSGNAHDESGYGHDGAVSGATLTTDRNGSANSAYTFGNKATLVASMPVGFMPVFDEPRTLAAWLRPSQGNNLLNVIYWGEGNCTGLQFGLGDQGDNAAFWGGCDDSTSSLPLPVGQWTFVAIVYSPSSPTSIAFYVNQTSGTGTITPLMTGGSASLVMGGPPGSSTFFTGDIDSVRVYGHALQPAEVASLLTAPDP
jgi:hypothetical protein